MTITAHKCKDCTRKVKWSGRGRKPLRCTIHANQARKAARQASNHRRRTHAKGQAVSRWGDLWLVNGKPIRRVKNQVWEMTGSQESVTSMSGIFHPIGKDGLPGEGFSTSHTDLQGVLKQQWERGQADEWLRTHPDWWCIEEHAHHKFTRLVTDSVVVHADVHYDRPDERSRQDRCTWCRVPAYLGWAGEFCSRECMAEHIDVWGADGIDVRPSGNGG
ncbi:hypothetical protein ACFVH6_25590 [Spirillospora sp. NPDC127200]